MLAGSTPNPHPFSPIAQLDMQSRWADETDFAHQGHRDSGHQPVPVSVIFAL